MVPGAGPFVGAADPTQLAHAADRMRAALSARFRSHDDVQLVMSPLDVLTPSSSTTWPTRRPKCRGWRCSSTPTSAPGRCSTPGCGT
ncbi:hypothetical protein NKH77_31490 [Streptomyces sp. M19]